MTFFLQKRRNLASNNSNMPGPIKIWCEESYETILKNWFEWTTASNVKANIFTVCAKKWRWSDEAGICTSLQFLPFDKKYDCVILFAQFRLCEKIHICKFWERKRVDQKIVQKQEDQVQRISLCYWSHETTDPDLKWEPNDDRNCPNFHSSFVVNKVSFFIIRVRFNRKGNCCVVGLNIE